ncbi:MAG TPA: glycosyltransferase family 2 protein [Fibrobacteria bacterium]|mgnify:CR=1 FL=1|nr:glycosyltransferase family 2 protein [Fibrobacteria bacterium]
MISVLVPVRNAAPWIESALRSVVGQTMEPGEILVADDASTDGTGQLVESLNLPGVRVLRTETNHGISWQLNRLVSEAKGRWLARMDGDDISLPDRFARQIDLMDRKGLAVCGTWCRRFGNADTSHHFATDDATIKSGLLFSVPFCHPSVVFDRDKLGTSLRYDPAFDVAEDYHLWTRLRFSGTFGNVPMELFHWRLHPSNAGSAPTSQGIQKSRAGKVRDLLLSEYGLEFDPATRDVIEKRCQSATLDLQDNRRFLSVLLDVSKLPESVIQASPAELARVLSAQWDLSCLFSAWSHKGTLRLWMEGRKALGTDAPVGTASKIFLKSLAGRLKRR